MKQTNNAIKFLMAQYRAIFKNAYFKGIASAVLLTAGLAAGTASTAQAADFYGYGNSIVQGWRDDTTTNAIKELNDENVAGTVNALANSNNLTNLASKLSGAGWSKKEIQNMQSGSLVHYSGAALQQGDDITAKVVKFINIMGKTNVVKDEADNLSLTNKVDGATLHLGPEGDTGLNIMRRGGGAKAAGGAVFAGYAASYDIDATKTSPTSLAVTNSTLTVSGESFADDAVIAGYAIHALSGDATVSGNDLRYTSSRIEQAADKRYGKAGAGIPSTMLAGGYARSNGGSASAANNTILLQGKDATDSKTDISAKKYYGAGYATTYDAKDDSSAKDNTSLSATDNSATLANLTYNATATAKELHIFGGIAKNQSKSNSDSGSNVGSVLAADNTLQLTDLDISTSQTDTQVMIYGGAASNGRLSKTSDGTSTVSANNNAVTIDAKSKDGATINLASVTAETSETAIIGGLAEQTSTTGKDVTVSASNNTVTVKGNVKINGAAIYGARAINSVTAQDSGATTTANNNSVIITGNAVLTNTSLYAAAVDATDNNKGNGITIKDNKLIVDSNNLVIADGQNVDLAGNTVEVKGKVWVKNGAGSEVTFGGVAKESAGGNTYFNGTGSLTGSLYNQGTVNVYDELDISKGTIYALADKATINVDGGHSAETNNEGNPEVQKPLTEGFATLKTSEQQIKNFLTAGSATNISLPVENKGDKATVVAKSSAGMLKVVSGGAVDFGTEVTLSDFNINTDEVAGAIVVDTSDSGSYFKADTVNVEHVLATNATTETDVDKLIDADASKVHLVANTLNLGSSSLTSEQSAAIKFADATVKNQINFAVTSGKDGDEGFILSGSIVKGDNYTITNSADSKSQYYTTDAIGSINGPVRIDTSAKLAIVNGDWQGNGSITLQGSGALSVGGQDKDPGKLSDNNSSLPDATLTLGSTLNIVGSADNETSVTVTGNAGSQAYDYEHAQETLGDDGLSLLDLSAGLAIVDADGKALDSYSGKTTITATSGGVVILNGTDVSKILAGNNSSSKDSGAFFEANNGGALVFATDGGALQAGFGDFDDANHGIDIATNGYLAAETINITKATPDTDTGSTSDPVDESGEWARNYVSFGGNVYVGDLNVSDLRNSTAGNYVSEAGIATGTVKIFNSLSSYNSTLHVGQDGGEGSATLTFFTPEVNGTGTIAGMSTLQVNNGSALNFDNGAWDAKGTVINLDNGSLTVGGDHFKPYDFSGNDTEATLSAKGLVVAADSSVTISPDGTATFGTADFSELGAPEDNSHGAVKVYGHLTIDDAASVTADDGSVTYQLFGADGSIFIGKNGVLTFGSAATNHAIIADGKYAGSGSVTSVFDENTEFGQIENQGGTLVLDLKDSTTFDSTAILELKHALFTANSFNGDLLKDGGVLNIGYAHFEGYNPTATTIGGVDGYTAKWYDLEDFADIYSPDVTNEINNKTNVTDVELNSQIIGHWGSLSLVPNVATGSLGAQATIAGDTSLNFAEGNNGFFISDSTHSEVLGAFINSGKALTLNNGGRIGKVTLESTSETTGDNSTGDSNTTLKVAGTGTTYIDSVNTNTANYGNTALLVTGTAEVANDVSNLGDVEAIGGTLTVHGNVSADYVGVEGTASMVVGKELKTSEVAVINGSLKATDFVFDNQGRDDDEVNIVSGGKFTAQTFTVANANKDGIINVGLDSEDMDVVNNNYLDTPTTGTGYFEVSTMSLNGATLVVDPAYDQATSIASISKFKNGNETYAYNTVTGTINGTVEIGQNAALGIGTSSVEEVAEVISAFQSNGALQADKYGSILYLNGQTKLAEGSSIALNAHALGDTKISDSLIYSKTDADKHVTSQYADLGLGENTALILSENAFDNTKGDRAGVALTFERAEATVAGNGGDIVLVGTFDASKPLNFFKDKGGKGQEGVNIQGQDIYVYTQNGFLFTVLEAGTVAGYGEQLEVNKEEAYSIMSEASDPVVETLIAYHEDRVATAPEEPETPAEPAKPEATDGTADQATKAAEPQVAENAPEQDAIGDKAPAPSHRVTGSSTFLNEVVTNSHGAPAEAAARLAVYGGAVQAAMAASSSTTDAIAARMGVGASANITMANNGQGAALWLAPVYKTHDSDSFDAQGLDYGVDMNLYGLALGADFEFMPGLTAGLMFNVGSGDVDGQGNAAANNTSNDFDYWGAAFYGNYTYDALSVTADLSYTAVDNDLEATTGMSQYGKLESSTDTTAISLGVTAKYTFDFGGVEVAPHAGLRYTNIDLDDYTVTSAGEDIAHYDADKLNLFSIPVGVTFAKEFTGDAWTVKPSLDLTLTGNFGDDDISGNVSWTGVEGLVTPVSSEYMDDFTYGATLGIEATSTSGFSLGLGVNYTGSSNVDEFGVQANARFMF